MKFLVTFLLAISRARSISTIDENHLEDNLRLKLLAYQNASFIMWDFNLFAEPLIGLAEIQ